MIGRINEHPIIYLYTHMLFNLAVHCTQYCEFLSIVMVYSICWTCGDLYLCIVQVVHVSFFICQLHELHMWCSLFVYLVSRVQCEVFVCIIYMAVSFVHCTSWTCFVFLFVHCTSCTCVMLSFVYSTPFTFVVFLFVYCTSCTHVVFLFVYCTTCTYVVLLLVYCTSSTYVLFLFMHCTSCTCVLMCIMYDLYTQYFRSLC